MQSYYQNLAGQYADFLSALGGISITILTLVLTLGRKGVEPKKYPALVVSLVLATFTSFAGAHLMVQAAATNPPPTLIQEAEKLLTGERLFVISSVDIYIATMLISFSLTLLPAAYSEKESDQENLAVIQLSTKGVFWAVLISVYLWTFFFFIPKLDVPYRYRIIIGATILSILLGAVYAWFGSRLKFPRLTSNLKLLEKIIFVKLMLFIGISVIWFACIDANIRPTWYDLVFASIVVLVSATSLLSLHIILFRKEGAIFVPVTPLSFDTNLVRPVIESEIGTAPDPNENVSTHAPTPTTGKSAAKAAAALRPEQRPGKRQKSQRRSGKRR